MSKLQNRKLKTKVKMAHNNYNDIEIKTVKPNFI